jgi:hypothetical protein
MRAALGLVLVLAACENVTPVPVPPEILAVDLVDHVSADQRHRMWAADGMRMTEPPPSGPDLTLRIYLSHLLSDSSRAGAQTAGVRVRDVEGTPGDPRSFRIDDSPELDPAAPAGTRQIIAVTPDLRTSRRYTLALDSSQLLDERRLRFQVPPALPFRTSDRFIVMRTEPPDGKPVNEVAEVRLHLSSVARMMERYGVSIQTPKGPASLSAQLSLDRRTLRVILVCPLPAGESRLTLAESGIHEDDTFQPLKQPFSMTLIVQRDPGPCMPPDMGRPTDM